MAEAAEHAHPLHASPAEGRRPPALKLAELPAHAGRHRAGRLEGTYGPLTAWTSAAAPAAGADRPFVISSGRVVRDAATDPSQAHPCRVRRIVEGLAGEVDARRIQP